MCKYVNLHNHSVYSNLDGYSTPERMVDQVIKLDQIAIGLTDHGNMAGAMDIKIAAEQKGVKAVMGNEFYMVPFGESAHDYRGKDKNQRFHLTAWCYNQVGYQNMLKLTELSSKVGFYYYPRIDINMLEQYNEGIIITSGCLASYVCQGFIQKLGDGEQRFRHTNESTRRVHDFFGWAFDVFGKDRFFVEVQDHDIDIIRKINSELYVINEKYFGFDYMATNDSHYVTPDDVDGHTSLLCLNSRCTLVNPKSFVQNYADHPDYYLTTYEQMKAKNYGFDVPDSAFTNTVKVVEMVEQIYMGYELEVKRYRFPVMPEYEDDYNGELEKAAGNGFRKIYGSLSSSDNVMYHKAIERLSYELDIISNLGFASYFLCVYDIKQFCDEHKIPMTVRGSAGGSIVLHCLGVTDFCPLEYDLLFERFLNPDRVSAPDADLDLDPTRRHEVVKYIVDKYGTDFVAQVSTFGYIKVKGAVRNATRLNEQPFDFGTILLERIYGEDFEEEYIDEIGDTDKEEEKERSDVEKFLEYYEKAKHTFDEETVLNTAILLHGQLRTVGIHAGAFLLSDRPLHLDYPMIRPPSASKNLTDLIVNVQYTKAEELGGIKLDLLNVKSLGILHHAIELINDRHGKDYRFENIPVDDSSSFELINSGYLAEIFQLTGYTARVVTAQIEPTNVRDVMAINAIARPGPLQYAQLYADRLHGMKKVEYDHPDLEPILSETQGIPIYQESIMRISQVICGFTGGEADLLRKAVSKKKGLDKMKSKFIKGGLDNGYDNSIVHKLWADILHWSGYGFNASHACAYSRLAVKMAYLKANYPIEFYAAALTGRASDEDKLGELLVEMSHFDISLLPPRLGKSNPKVFTVDDEAGGLRYPYGSIKNVGKAGNYLKQIDLDNIDNVTSEQLALFKKAGKRPLESLAIVGALDHLFPTRNHAVRAVEYLSRGLPPIRQAAFLPDEDIYTEAEFYTLERKLTGLYLTGHPLDKYNLQNQIPFDNQEVYETMHGEIGLFIGVVHAIRLHRDRNNNVMAFVEMEDKQYNTMSVVVFASLYDKDQDKICLGCVCKVLGKINVRYGRDEEEESKLKKYGRVSILAGTIIGE